MIQSNQRAGAKRSPNRSQTTAAARLLQNELGRAAYPIGKERCMMDQRLQECLTGREGSYILPFFWQHGESHEELLKELEAIQASNVREFCVESRIYEDFCGEQWWKDFGFLLEEAKKREMKVWLLDDKKFPTGYANGIMEQYPHLKKRAIREEHADLLGPVAQAGIPCYGRLHSEQERLLGVYAWKRGENGETLCGQPVDLTPLIQDEIAYWDIPEGVWRIFFVVDTDASPEPYAPYIDMLTKESCELMLKAVYQPHYDHFASYFGNTFQGFFSDEPCFGNDCGHYYSKLGTPGICFPWKDGLKDLLAQELGRSVPEILSFIPALWYDCGPVTTQLRTAYMDVISRLYSENFCWMLGDWCREHHVSYIGHVIEDLNAHMRTGYGSGHFFRALDGQDMAGMDLVLNQLVPGMSEHVHTASVAGGVVDPEFFTYTLGKMAASHSHLQPLKQGRAMCEIFGAFGWAEGLPMMKQMADECLVSGINRFVPHAFTPRFPDHDCPPHFYCQGKNPQYPLFGNLMQYMQRVSHLLTDGVHQASAAVLYNAQAEWAGGDYQLFQAPCKVLTRAQIDFDIVHEDLFYQGEAAMEQGKLVINGERFGALVIPYSQYLPYRLIAAFGELARQGLPVLFVDGLCQDSCEHQEIRGFDSLFRTVPLAELPAYLRGIGAFELELEAPSPDLRFYHIRREEADLYFFYNQSHSRPVSTRVKLPQTENGVFYDPFGNTVWNAELSDGWLPIYLPAGCSVMAVFGGTVPAEQLSQPPAAYLAPDKAEPLDGLRFAISLMPFDQEDFAPYREDSPLFNLTSPAGNPRFCGTVRYETDLELSPGSGRILMDLGAVGETAKVTLNGVSCGVRIQAPYRFDLTQAIKPGKNRLIVETTNNLAYQIRDGFSRSLPFSPTGILGPVTIERVK